MPGTMGDILAAGHGQSGAIGAPGRPFLGYAGLRRAAVTTTGGAERRSASAAATGSRSCCRTGRRWRRPSSRSPPPRRPRRSIRPTARRSSSSTSPTSSAKALVAQPRAGDPARAVAASARRAGPAAAIADGRAGRRLPPALDGLPIGVAAAPAARRRPTTSRCVLHTSGTTSRPKIVPLTPRQPRRLGAATSARRWR